MAARQPADTGLSLNMEDRYSSDASSICNSPGAWPGFNIKKNEKKKPKPKVVVKKLTKCAPLGSAASTHRIQAPSPSTRNVEGQENSEAELHHLHEELRSFSHQRQSSSMEHGFIGGLKLKLVDEATTLQGKTPSPDRQGFKMFNKQIVVQTNHISPDDVHMREPGSLNIQDQDIDSRLKQIGTLQLLESHSPSLCTFLHDHASFAARIAKESSRTTCLTHGNLNEPPLATNCCTGSKYQPFESSQSRRPIRHENIRAAAEVDLASIRPKSLLSTDQCPEASVRPKSSAQLQTAQSLMPSEVPQGPRDGFHIDPNPKNLSVTGRDFKDEREYDCISSGQNDYERKKPASSLPKFENITEVSLLSKLDGLSSSAPPSTIESLLPEASKLLSWSSRRGSAASMKSPRSFWRRSRGKSDQIPRVRPVTNAQSSLQPLSMPSQTSGPRAAQPQEPLAKMFVVCCNCNLFHDLPFRVYEAIASASNVNQEREGGLFEQTSKTVPCPWCHHAMTTKCCAGYAAFVFIKERFH
jgi:hypothetical protein